MSTKAEKRYMNRVAELGCVVCRMLGYGSTPAQLHHVREGQGMAQRAQNWLVVPLCPEHHQGKTGVHGDRSAMRQLKVDELDLLSQTIQDLNA